MSVKSPRESATDRRPWELRGGGGANHTRALPVPVGPWLSGFLATSGTRRCLCKHVCAHRSRNRLIPRQAQTLVSPAPGHVSTEVTRCFPLSARSDAGEREGRAA